MGSYFQTTEPGQFTSQLENQHKPVQSKVINDIINYIKSGKRLPDMGKARLFAIGSKMCLGSHLLREYDQGQVQRLCLKCTWGSENSQAGVYFTLLQAALWGLSPSAL